jgi:hypothetical protein
MWVLISNRSSMGQTMSGDERAQFLAWDEEQKEKIFHNKEVIGLLNGRRQCTKAGMLCI